MIDRQFIVERQGRQFVLYAGLLNLAHQQGLKAIRTRLLQIPADDNGQVATVHAEVETDRGTFSGIGDASPSNVARAMLACTIRLAETRAKARALRDAVNVGVAALEEMGDGDETSDLASIPPSVTMRTHPRHGDNDSNSRPVVETGEFATPAQKRAIERLATLRGVNLTRAGVDLTTLTKTAAGQLIQRWGQEAKTSA